MTRIGHFPASLLPLLGRTQAAGIRGASFIPKSSCKQRARGSMLEANSVLFGAMQAKSEGTNIGI